MPSQVESVFRRVQHALGFGRTGTDPDDSGDIQTVQVLRNELQRLEAVPVAFPWGFSSVAPAGSTPVHLATAGDLANGVVVSKSHPASRPRNQAVGTTILYDLIGTLLRLTNDGNATFSGTGTLTLDFPKIVINGQVLASGNVTAGVGGASVELLGHAHKDSGGQGTGGPPVAGS